MKTRRLLAAVALSTVGLTTIGLAPVSASVAHDAGAAARAGHDVGARHACTRTSSGSCIRGGQFCPQAKYGRYGWDAQGRRYTCKGNRTHPHWMK